jgi:hypothetical protein
MVVITISGKHMTFTRGEIAMIRWKNIPALHSRLLNAILIHPFSAVKSLDIASVTPIS